MAKKERKPMYTTSLGVAVGFVHLNSPDTDGEYADDKYKVALAFDAEDKFVQDTCAKLDELCANTHAEAIENAKNAKTKKKLKEGEPYVPYEDELDEDGEPTGRIILKFGTKGFFEDKNGEVQKKTLKMYDAKKKLMKKPPFIGPGSELKVAFSIGDGWVNAGQGMAGNSLYLNAVQVISAENSGGASAEDFGFGEEDDGYSHEEDDDAPASGGSSEDDDDGDDDGDF